MLMDSVVAETGWFPCCGIWEPELECGAGSVGLLVCAQLTFTHSLSAVCVPCDVQQFYLKFGVLGGLDKRCSLHRSEA